MIIRSDDFMDNVAEKSEGMTESMEPCLQNCSLQNLGSPLLAVKGIFQGSH